LPEVAADIGVTHDARHIGAALALVRDVAPWRNASTRAGAVFTGPAGRAILVAFALKSFTSSLLVAQLPSRAVIVLQALEAETVTLDAGPELTMRGLGRAVAVYTALSTDAWLIARANAGKRDTESLLRWVKGPRAVGVDRTPKAKVVDAAPATAMGIDETFNTLQSRSWLRFPAEKFEPAIEILRALLAQSASADRHVPKRKVANAAAVLI
jgi:hypothetical protein